MATAASRAVSLTTLVIGRVEVAVGLFTTVAKPGKLEQFATAGPNGGVLVAREVARALPAGDAEVPGVPVHSDPLADELVPCDGAVLHGTADVPVGYPKSDEVPGEYGHELVEEGTGEIVLPQDVRRGVRLEDGSFIDCTDQLAKIDEQTRLERIEVVPGGFIDITRVPRARVAATYYIGAGDEKAPRALRMMYEALRRKRRGAVVKLTKRSRQSLGVIGWHGKCLALYEITWAENFREPPARALAIQKATVSDAEVDAFCELVDAWSGRVETLDELRDDAVALRQELMAKARAGEVAQMIKPPAEDAPDDVLAQLEASLAAVS